VSREKHLILSKSKCLAASSFPVAFNSEKSSFNFATSFPSALSKLSIRSEYRSSRFSFWASTAFRAADSVVVEPAVTVAEIVKGAV